MTLKFDRWPRKIVGHLFYITSSFVHHLKPLGEFKLELLSGSAQFGSKSAIFLSRVTLKFNGWPWKTKGHLFYTALSCMHHLIVIGDFKIVLQPGNAQFGSKSAIFPRVTLKLDKWPRKTIGHLFRPSNLIQIGLKSSIFPWNLMDDPEKQYGTSSMLLKALCIIS